MGYFRKAAGGCAMMDSDEDAAGIIKGGTVSRAEDTEPENSILFRQHLVVLPDPHYNKWTIDIVPPWRPCGNIKAEALK